MKIKGMFLAAVALAFPAFSRAQAASTFVKAAPEYCWQDVKDYVKANADGFSADESQHVLKVHVREVSTGAGDISVAIRTMAEKNKKGEEGCSIVVNQEGSAPVGSYIQRGNPKFTGENIEVANRIAAYVAAKEKARRK
jgi:hypothetical protein